MGKALGRRVTKMRCVHVLRKPMTAENTAANVVCEGAGGLNINGTRIPVQEGEFLQSTGGKPVLDGEFAKRWTPVPRGQSEGQKIGRFPANLILDDNVDLSGVFPRNQSDLIRQTESKGQRVALGKFKTSTAGGYTDAGSASRYFFHANKNLSKKSQ
jgi:hypothetical protein